MAAMSAEYLATVGATLESTIREAVKVAVLERAPNAAQRVAECINPAAADERLNCAGRWRGFARRTRPSAAWLRAARPLLLSGRPVS